MALLLVAACAHPPSTIEPVARPALSIEQKRPPASIQEPGSSVARWSGVVSRSPAARLWAAVDYLHSVAAVSYRQALRMAAAVYDGERRPVLSHREEASRPSTPTGSGSVWGRLAMCESGGDWSISTGSFEGGIQFMPATWRSVTAGWRRADGSPYPLHAYDATPTEQIAAGEALLATSGWGAWPGCARKLGLL